MMKKITLYLLLIIGLISCKGEDGRDGKDGIDGKVHIESIEIEIASDDWILVGQANEKGSYYFKTIDINELTSKNFDYSLKQAFIRTADGRQRSLTHTENHGNSKDGIWSEVFSCEFEANKITFIVSYSDFKTSNRPGTIKYDVILAW